MDFEVNFKIFIAIGKVSYINNAKLDGWGLCYDTWLCLRKNVQNSLQDEMGGKKSVFALRNLKKED